jgi:hypothetical protein
LLRPPNRSARYFDKEEASYVGTLHKNVHVVFLGRLHEGHGIDGEFSKLRTIFSETGDFVLNVISGLIIASEWAA